MFYSPFCWLVGPLCLAAPQLLLAFYKEEGCERGEKHWEDINYTPIIDVLYQSDILLSNLRAEA